MAVALSRGPMLTKSMLEDLTRPLKELKSGLYTSDKKSFLEIDFAPRCDLFLRSNFHHFKYFFKILTNKFKHYLTFYYINFDRKLNWKSERNELAMSG